jgi:hypothetical protein
VYRNTERCPAIDQAESSTLTFDSCELIVLSIGEKVGATPIDGIVVSGLVGSSVGLAEGTTEGASEGAELIVGDWVGKLDIVGTRLGEPLGKELGDELGATLMLGI